MDSFPEKLRALSHNKYFAFAAVIFFAFLTALVFAVFALQSPNSSDPDAIRTAIQKDSPYLTPLKPAPSPASALDKLVSILTGKKIDTTSSSSQPTQNSPQTAQKSATALPSQSTAQGQTQAPSTFDATIPSRMGPDAGSAPSISIKRHILVTKLPDKPSAVNIHQLKTDYATDDIKAFAYKLGFVNIDAVEKGAKLTQLYDIDNKHYLALNAASGRFSYLSQTGFHPERQASTPMQMAKYLLLQLGIDDPSIKPYATYKRKGDVNNYIYIELHRDWQNFGGPIMNPVGMLNMKENSDVADTKLGALQDFPLANQNIIETSDNTDGFARRDDFNTITVKYQPVEGKVYGISSNVPLILQSENVPDDAVKTPTQAYQDYVAGKTTLAITGPSGTGSVSLPDVYSNNAASAQSVDVTDAEVMYVSSPSTTPQWWCPVYLFRSFGKVQTGFDVQFVHTVPAVQDARCEAAVLGATTQRLLAQQPATPTSGVPVTQVAKDTKAGSSLQYGTVEFVYQVVIDTPVNQCPVNLNHAQKIAETSDTVEYIMWQDRNRSEVTPGNRYIPRSWYYVVKKKAGSQLELTSLSPTKTKAQLLQLRVDLVGECTIGSSSECPLPRDLSGLETVTCQFITTGSPWIYVYPDSTVRTKVALGSDVPVAYAQPAFTSGYAWEGTALPSGHLELDSGLQAQALHWEYDTTAMRALYAPFTDPDQPGFVVETDQLKSFTAELAHRIGLNTLETQNLLSELERSSSKFTTPFVKIAFVPQEFLSTRVPLYVSPQPDSLSRIYLELTGLTTYPRLPLPELPSLTRNGSTVVEVGLVITSYN